MRILFVIPSLGPGGAERVASLLVNEWVRDGHEVTLVTFEMPGAEPFFALDQRVNVRVLAADSSKRGIAARLGANVARVTRFRLLVKELHPDAVVAFMTEANVVALAAAKGLGIPVVVSERNQPDRPGLARVHRLARRLTYPAASAIVVQTEAIASWVKQRFAVPVQVIPNPVRVETERAAPQTETSPTIVSMGRLTHQKGFDVLLRSFAAIAPKHPDWQLVIYGEGPARDALQRLAAASGYQDRISFPGLTKDSAAVLRQASLFVLPSRFEGYPNVLIEALAAGLPVIATSCPGGSSEILGEGKYGLLVTPDDPSALSEALDTMMSSADLRASYASRGRDAVASLEIGKVSRRWLDLLARSKGSAG